MIHGKVKTIEYDAAGNVIRYSGKNCEDASDRQGKLPPYALANDFPIEIADSIACLLFAKHAYFQAAFEMTAH